MVESEERNYQDQRRRLQADHANRVAECEEREAQAVADKERAIRQAQEEAEEKLQVRTHVPHCFQLIFIDRRRRQDAT